MMNRRIEKKERARRLKSRRPHASERKKARDELQRQREELQTIFDSVPAMIFQLDKEHRLVRVNRAYAESVGLPREELEGKSTLEVFPLQAEGYWRDDDEVIKSEQPKWNITESFETAKGTRWAQTDKLPYRDRSGNVAGVLAFALDITDRTHMEKALQESEEKYRALVENSPSLIGIFQDGGLKYVNNAGIRKLGWTYEELISPSFDPIEKIVSQKSRSLLKENISKRLRGEDIALYEISLIKKDGSEVPVLVRGAKIIYNQKPAIEFVFDDITERKAAEQILRLRSEIVETMLEGLVLIRATDGIIVYANPQIEKMFGYDSDEMIGMNIATTNAPTNGKSPEAVAREIEAHVRRFGRWSGEILNKKKDGTPFWCQSNLSTLESSEYGTIWITVKEDITERRLAEETLKKSEKRFREAMEATNDGLWDWNVQSGDMYYSPAYYRILGYEPGSFPADAQFWLDHLHPDDRARAIKANEDCIENRVSNFKVEFRMRTKSGEWKWILGRGRASVRDASGRALRMIGTHQDVTERKRAEEKLLESEQLYRTLAESSPDDIFIVGPDARVQYMNRSGLEHWGLTLEQITGKRASDLFPPEVAKRAAVPVSTVFQTGEPLHAENTVSFPGAVSWRDEYWLPLKTGSETTAVLGISRDITKRKRMEQELKQYSGHLEQVVQERTNELRSARERLDYLIKANPAVIYSAKPLPDLSDFALTYLSERVFSMLGYEPGEFIGHPEFWTSHIHPEDLQLTMAAIQRLWKEGQYAFEYRFLHKDGSYRWIREEAKVDRDSHGKPTEVYGYWIDATERRKLEAYLSDAQRLIAIGQTTAMVGHDLRNPLQAIATTVHLMRKQYESTPNDQKNVVTKFGESDMLDTIEDSVYYMNKIVSDLQTYAEPRILQLTQVSLSQLLNESISIVQMPWNIKVFVSVTEDFVLADPVIERVFINLLLNAVQAMPNGGELTVKTERQGKDVLIHFQDTGVGIPEKNLPKLFDPLFTTKAKGQGLGLAVCKRLIDAHEGSISVESTVDKGSTFTVKLPLKR